VRNGVDAGAFLIAGPVMCDVYRVLMKCSEIWITRVNWHAYTIHLTASELVLTCATYVPAAMRPPAIITVE